VDTLESPGVADIFIADQNLYFGGFPAGNFPYTEINPVNFVGCIEDAFLGPDRIELVAGSIDAVNVEPGCSEKVKGNKSHEMR